MAPYGIKLLQIRYLGLFGGFSGVAWATPDWCKGAKGACRLGWQRQVPQGAEMCFYAPLSRFKSNKSRTAQFPAVPGTVAHCCGFVFWLSEARSPCSARYGSPLLRFWLSEQN
jgi:hypothetical protein